MQERSAAPLVVCPPRLAAARRGVGARRSSSCLALEGPDANEDIDHFLFLFWTSRMHFATKIAKTGAKTGALWECLRSVLRSPYPRRMAWQGLRPAVGDRGIPLGPT